MKVRNVLVKYKRAALMLALVLSAVLFSGTAFAWDSVQVQYQCGDKNATTSSISFYFKILNNGTTNLRLSDIKVRYWLTADSSSSWAFYCDYASCGTANVTGTFYTMGTPVTNADTYLEFTFNISAGIIGPGENSGDIQLRFNKVDYSVCTQTNDYSFDSTLTAYTLNPKMTAYTFGELRYGTEPSGTAAPTAPPIGTMNITIDTNAERAAISPYIYGTNQDLTGSEGWTTRRMGGNRMTGYNWENNYSNAGSDWNHSSDDFVVANLGVPTDQRLVPGMGMTWWHDTTLSMGGTYSLITLQMAGYASKDGNGTVLESEVAPSARWVAVQAAKGSAFSLTPDLTDNYVYMDECVNFLVNKYGNALSSTGIKGYSLDNEPALWQNTHPRIHPTQPTCTELITKSVALSKAIKNVDANAEVIGLVSYGFAEMASFQGATDWDTVKGSCSWYVDYFLSQMKSASDTAGKRLLDVVDYHWYPEAQGGGSRITFGTFDATNIYCNKARIQAPRTLWDPTYLEKSWIGQWFDDYLPLIPKMKSSIDTWYPGTKLGCTEYNYGGDPHISGGIAMADAIGIYGKYGMYLATYWTGDSPTNYASAAFKLYRNYDGAGSTYGDTKVSAETNDWENSSVYASIPGTDDTELHVIVMNKNYDSALPFSFSISSSRSYTSARIWAYDSASYIISERTGISGISGNAFTCTIPALTVYHMVLSGSGTVTAAPTTPPIVTDVPTVAPTDAPVITDAPTTPPVSTDVPVDTIAPTAEPTAVSDTPAPTDAPTVTPGPTDTPAPTAIPTATPVGVTADPTTPPADTLSPTDAPVVTDAPTDAPVVTSEPTSPPVTGCTCTNLCSSQTAITVPFTYDGAGEYCYTASSLGSYVNSWNCDSVNVNGTSCTNTYVSSSSISAINGVYYIYFKASYSWSHIEIK